MRSWAAAIIFACGCLILLVSAAKHSGEYRTLWNVIVLTGQNVGDRTHCMKYEGDSDADQFCATFCDEESLYAGVVIKKLVYRHDYLRNCWDISYPGGVEFRRDNENHVVLAVRH